MSFHFNINTVNLLWKELINIGYFSLFLTQLFFSFDSLLALLSSSKSVFFLPADLKLISMTTAIFYFSF